MVLVVQSHDKYQSVIKFVCVPEKGVDLEGMKNKLS
jgi:hypothetical protein